MSSSRLKITLAIQGIIDTNYVDYSKRICYASEMFQDTLDGLEVGFFADQIHAIETAMNDIVTRESLSVFENNSVHIAIRESCQADKNIDRIVHLCNQLYEEHLVSTISFHLDMSAWFDYVRISSNPKMPLLWENLGKEAMSGNTYKEALKAIEVFPDWGIVFDIAHCLEMESVGEPGPRSYLGTMGDKIKQIHFSWPGNLYEKYQVCKKITTAHSLVYINKAERDKLIYIIRDQVNKIITIEGVVVPGEYGVQSVEEEAAFIRQGLPLYQKGLFFEHRE